VDHDLLDDEAHSGKTLPAWGVFPDRFFVNFVNSEKYSISS
jgi:hypothetical protein